MHNYSFLRYDSNDHIGSLMMYGIDCGHGWYTLIDALCYTIEMNLGFTTSFKVVQIKEKYGGLRFYTVGGDEKIQGMISLAESMSYNICEICGNAGKLRDGSWIRTLCDEHAKKRKKNDVL